MKQIKILFSIIVLCLLNGCYTYRHSPKPEIADLKGKIPYCADQDMAWGSVTAIAEEEVQRDLSLSDAICKTLLVDNDLNANLETIGIAKADLIQAGYFKNPVMENSFGFSRSTCTDFGGNLPYFDIQATFAISDFWQIPRKKKVAQKDLEIATVTILKQIVDISADVHIAYYTYLYEQEQYKVVKKIVDSLQTIIETYQDTYEAGYIGDYDRYFAKSIMAQWELKLFDQEKAAYIALINLRNYMNLEYNATPIPLLTSWDQVLQDVPHSAALYAYAAKSNLDAQIANLKIEQARHNISLSRAKIFDNVSVGIEYVKQNGVSYIGPTFDFDLPVFDQQQAQIEKYRRIEEKEKQALKNVLSNLGADIFNICERIKISHKKIAFYRESVLPTSKATLDFSRNNHDALKLDFSLFLTTHINLMEQEFKLNAEYLAHAKAVSELEKRLSGPIPYNLPPDYPELRTVNKVSADVLVEEFEDTQNMK